MINNSKNISFGTNFYTCILPSSSSSVIEPFLCVILLVINWPFIYAGNFPPSTQTSLGRSHSPSTAPASYTTSVLLVRTSHFNYFWRPTSWPSCAPCAPVLPCPQSLLCWSLLAAFGAQLVLERFLLCPAAYASPLTHQMTGKSKS